MNVKIQDIIRKIYLDPFGITDDEIEEAVTSPDSKKILNLEEYVVNLFLKRTSKKFYLLVDARGGLPYNLAYAFRIFEHTLNGVSIDNPLHVLQHFTRGFGHTLSIGDQYGTYIYHAEFVIPRENDQTKSLLHLVNAIKVVDLEKDEEHIKNAIVKFSRNTEKEDLGQVSFAYVINIPKYIRYLNENDPGSVMIPPDLD
jgi:hypothetical protein